MVTTQYFGENQQRRIKIRETKQSDGRPLLNGIDYLEVSADQQTLYVYFIHALEDSRLHPDNLQIINSAGEEETLIASVTDVNNFLVIQLNSRGNSAPYTLRLIKSPTEEQPPDGFDSQLSQVNFKFGLTNISEFDCQPSLSSPAKSPPPPNINYLAKDYDSFRQLMLNQLAVTIPDWQERSPADLGIMLVELLAYASDHLSYYQDAVATEAYLGTARKRVSVRRHARLLDYYMHDGCNARGWVALQIQEGTTQVLKGRSENPSQPRNQLLTRVDYLPTILDDEQWETAINAGAQVFELLDEQLDLYSSLNKIQFYVWGNDECYLPVGATQAYLEDTGGFLAEYLTEGRVLIFAEIKSPITGQASNFQLHHRHAVRLRTIIPQVDPLFTEPNTTQSQRLVLIEWDLEDALPFQLDIAKVIDDEPVHNLSVVYGNVVLVDHGRTIVEDLPAIPTIGLNRPRLKYGPLTQQGRILHPVNRNWVTFNSQSAAKTVFSWQLRNVLPSIVLTEENQYNLGGQHWYPVVDLLNSSPFARNFVVETEDDGRAYLRFGDNNLGKRPSSDTQLQAVYRIGNGLVGNVGADAIAHIYFPHILDQQTSVITKIFNPLPAQGGVAAESLEQVRLYAPQAFREPKRAVTAQDYANFAQQYSGVKRALATLRWTGSWYTIFITVARETGLEVDANFAQNLLEFLEPFRLAGHDLKIESPRFVPLDLALRIQVTPGYFPNQVKAALLTVFSDRVNSDGELGFFYPDNFTFGQPVYLSQVIANAVKVPGVRSAKLTRFQRQGQPANNELDRGQITLARLEIAQLKNDPNFPSSGRIIFDLEGGL